MPEPISVDFEYGELKEVIVGVGVMRYPDVERVAWAHEALKVLPEAEAAKVRERSGKDSRDLPKYGLMETENDSDRDPGALRRGDPPAGPTH